MLDILIARVHKKIQAAVFLFQIRKQQHLRRVVGAIHIVNMEFLEIANDNPARVQIMRQIPGITPRLLIRRQHRAVGLPVSLVQVNILPLLLDQYAGRLNQTVNKAGVVQLHAHLKINVLVRLGYAINLLQKRHPESLRFLLFVAASLPVGRKFFRGRSFFHIGHGASSCVILLLDRYMNVLLL